MSSNRVSRRIDQARLLGSLAAAMLLMVFLAACGDSDATQRKAFIDYLQANIVDARGLRMPQPTAEQSEAFGPYGDQLKVISDFHGAMNARVGGPLEQVIAKGSINSIEDAIARKDEIRSVRDAMKGVKAALDEESAKAQAARDSLKQPEDLKAVYDKAFEKSVVIPAKTFQDVFPNLDGALASALKLVDYLETHKDKIKVSGSMMETNDPAVQNDVNTMIGELNDGAQKVAEAQRALQKVMLGN